MDKFMRLAILWISALCIITAILILLFGNVRADEITCPPGFPSCKILVITPQEEQTLTGPNAIFDMARWASRPLGDWIDGWKAKLALAPAGKPFTPPAPPKTEEK